MANKNYNTYFSPRVSGILGTIAGAALIYLSLDGGRTIQIVFGSIILISSVLTLIKSK